MAVTADAINGGRILLGVGAGWYNAEHEAFGFPVDHRVSRFEEAVRILTSLLNDGFTPRSFPPRRKGMAASSARATHPADNRRERCTNAADHSEICRRVEHPRRRRHERPVRHRLERRYRGHTGSDRDPASLRRRASPASQAYRGATRAAAGRLAPKLSDRAHKARWERWCVPAAVLIHTRP